MTRLSLQEDRDRQREQASARRRMDKQESLLHPFPENGSPIQKAVHEAGGTVLHLRFSEMSGQNGGCGSPTYVDGTNGGTIPCGAMLTQFGKTKPYYCEACESERDSV